MTLLSSQMKPRLKVHIINDADKPGASLLMEKMYTLFNTIFPIPEERASLEALLDALRVNKDEKLQLDGGPSLESWIMLETDSGEIIGALNTLSISSVRESPAIKAEIDGAQELIYVFIDPRYRGMNLNATMKELSTTYTREFLAKSHNDGRSTSEMDFICGGEQNNPLGMNLEDALLDTEGAKVEQLWRRQYFQDTLGFGQIDFPYIQAPLSPRAKGGQHCEKLNFIVQGVPGPTSKRAMQKRLNIISPAILKFKLYNYFNKSMAAGEYDLKEEPAWIKQCFLLDKMIAQGRNIPIIHDQDFNGLAERYRQALIEIPCHFSDHDDVMKRPMGEIIGVTKIPLLDTVLSPEI